MKSATSKRITRLRKAVGHCDEVIADTRRRRAEVVARIRKLSETAEHAIGAQDE